jgi:glycosyltransferase involved in cell wall biosynthesis
MGIDPVPNIPEQEWRNPFYKEQPIITGILRGIPWKGDDILEQLAEEYPINIYKNISNQYLDQVLWRSDIFLSASLVEGFNLPVLEAMAHGCCCITTNNGAICDYSDMGSGVMFVNRTIDSFRVALDDLKHNPEKIREISMKAKELSEEWTIQRTITEFEKVLEDVVKKY